MDGASAVRRQLGGRNEGQPSSSCVTRSLARFEALGAPHLFISSGLGEDYVQMSEGSRHGDQLVTRQCQDTPCPVKAWICTGRAHCGIHSLCRDSGFFGGWNQESLLSTPCPFRRMVADIIQLIFERPDCVGRPTVGNQHRLSKFREIARVH